ncbi:MAG: hypothetical protein L6R36_005195 [Xanthoria steineri]|nr:MAG: hypothetical protein L6R36_005195 [Xanthoria steineri]
MPLHQRKAFSTSHSTSSVPENGPPPVPLFPDSSPLDMAALDDMINGSPPQVIQPSSSVLTTVDPHFASSSTWPAPSGSNTDYDVQGYQVGAANVTAYPSTGLLRVDSTSSTDTPLTVSPAQLHHSGPSSGYMGSQFTPATDYTSSPVPFSSAYSNQTSPDDFGQATPYMHDLDLDQSQLGSAFFGALPDFPVAPAASDSPTQTAPVPSRKSAPGKSPRTPLSTVVDSRVRKPRSKPLPDICPDPNDPKKMKTARNTAAARKSRARKVERFETLAAENDMYKAQLEDLQSQAAQAEVWKKRALELGWPAGVE